MTLHLLPSYGNLVETGLSEPNAVEQATKQMQGVIHKKPQLANIGQTEKILT